MLYRYYSSPLTWPIASAVGKVGIPGLPDLTQPAQIMGLAGGWLAGLLVASILIIGLGLVIALINFSLKPHQSQEMVAIGGWVSHYSKLVKYCQHAALILSLLILGFFLCSTLANRYHFWEQAKFVRANSQSIVQLAPQVKYAVKEPFSYTTQLNGRVVKVQDRKDVTKLLLPASSNIQVKIASGKSKNIATQPQATVNFVGEYSVRNIAPAGSNLELLMPPPTGSSAVQNFTVEQDGRLLTPLQAGVYALPLALNGTSQLRVSYQAQGFPSWQYDSKSQMLSGFKMAVTTDSKDLDAIASLPPSLIEDRLQGRVFSWNFDENVTVAQAFGIAPIVSSVKQLGIFPRLLIVAPVIWLWWLILLYLSVPLRLRDVVASSGAFWAVLWVLVYSSRLLRTELVHLPVTPQILWLILAALVLIIVLIIGRDRRISLQVALCITVGFFLPVLALISNYSGLLLGLAGILSLGWLATPQWYGRVRRSRRSQPEVSLPASEQLKLDDKLIDPDIREELDRN